jgi:hypothetical protein
VNSPTRLSTVINPAVSPVAARKVDDITVQFGPIMADPADIGNDLTHIALAAVGHHVAARVRPRPMSYRRILVTG